MRVLFDYYRISNDRDETLRLGVGWYRHHKKHPYKGFTVVLRLIWWDVILTYVNNYKAYSDTQLKRRTTWKRFKEKLEKK